MAQAPVPMVCWFKKLIGIPCPTCGSTRALRALLELQFADAFLWNPAVVCGAVAVAIFSAYTIASRIFKLPYPHVQMNKKEEYRLVFSLFAGLGVNWIYLIIAGV